MIRVWQNPADNLWYHSAQSDQVCTFGPYATQALCITAAQTKFPGKAVMVATSRAPKDNGVLPL